MDQTLEKAEGVQQTATETGSCPVCGNEGDNPGKCEVCGYEMRYDYEKMPTLGRLTGDRVPVSVQILRYEAAGEGDPDAEVRKVEEQIRQAESALNRMEEEKKALEQKIREQKESIGTLKELLEKKKLEAERKRRAAARTVTVGSIHTFGRYVQSKDGGTPEPIEWVVLDQDEEKGSVLLLSRYALTARRFHREWKDANWGNSELRSWLNDDFLRKAFDASERAGIRKGPVKADPNPKYSDVDPGKDTEDAVFLLSLSEVAKYLDTEEKRCCQPTEAAKAEDARVMPNSSCWWWLRTPGMDDISVVYIRHNGNAVLGGGDAVEYRTICVRPAVWVDKKVLLGPEQDEEEVTTKVEPMSSENSAFTPGTVVNFGTYAQDAKGTTPTPMEWIVLDKDEEKGKALILSRYGLDVKQYHGNGKYVAWQICDLRQWLNGDFLANSFDEKEKGRILESLVKAESNKGRDTKDRVFLLSMKEAEQYLDTKEKRQCQPTMRAVEAGGSSDGSNCMWWLRSPGCDKTSAAYIGRSGRVSSNGLYVSSGRLCVRPAMWIDL